MKNKIIIIANGTIKNLNFHKKILKDADLIICADGGAISAKKMDIIPDYIIGDFDSVNQSTIDFYKKKGKTEIIEDNNQYKTDLELALELAETLEPNEILILGAIGDRIDHTLANILCLTNIKTNVKTQLIDDKNTMELVDRSIDITGEKDDIISVVPLTDLMGLTYNGLKWIVSNKDTKFGWFGISNKMSKNYAKIRLKKGKFLLIKIRE
jgi:thiamine pyrophosphokinase